MLQLYTKYLSGNPLPWLLSECGTPVSYLTARDISDSGQSPDYNGLASSMEARRLLFKLKNLLKAGKPGFELPDSGLTWLFAAAVEHGLDRRSPEVAQAAERIVEATRQPDGDFSLSWKPAVSVACRTGDMARYLILSGCCTESADTAINWITDHQRHDGGWLHCPLGGTCDALKLFLFNRSGRGIERENSLSVSSCIYASAACSHALSLSGSQDKTVRFRAAEYFLKRNLYLSLSGGEMRPARSWNCGFLKPGYPVLSQYDILYGLLITARLGFADDERNVPAFNRLMSLQNSDGTWNLDNTGPGMINKSEFGATAGKRSPWVTLNALRLLSILQRIQ